MKAVVAALTALAAVSAAPAHASIEPGTVAFDVWMNGKPVGTHTVSVERSGERAIAKINISLKGKVGPFGFTYAHTCTETWEGALLQSLSCVDRDGDKERRLEAKRVGDTLKITSPSGEREASGALLPSSWWRADLVKQSRMLDTRKGEALPITVTRLREETLPGGVQATRYRVKGSAAVDVWYDAEGRWVNMSFRLRGQSFEYRPRTAAAEAPTA